MTLGGNEMESGETKDVTPIGQSTRWKMAWKQVLVMVNGCQMLEYLQNIVIPARDKRKKQVYKPNILMDKQVKLAVLNYSSKQIYISANKSINYCRNNHQNCQIIIGE